MVYTELALRRQKFHVAPSMAALEYTTLVELQKPRYKKLVTHVESHASAVSLLESGEQRYIKAINNTTTNKGAGIAQWLERRTRD